MIKMKLSAIFVLWIVIMGVIFYIDSYRHERAHQEIFRSVGYDSNIEFSLSKGIYTEPILHERVVNVQKEDGTVVQGKTTAMDPNVQLFMAPLHAQNDNILYNLAGIKLILSIGLLFFMLRFHK